MKKTLGIVLGCLLLASLGCQDGTFINLGNRDADDYGVASDSIDRYAEESGITRQEAIEELRQQRAMLDGQQPPVDPPPEVAR